jgi:hypothetical protein
MPGYQHQSIVSRRKNRSKQGQIRLVDWGLKDKTQQGRRNQAALRERVSEDTHGPRAEVAPWAWWSWVQQSELNCSTSDYSSRDPGQPGSQEGFMAHHERKYTSPQGRKDSRECAVSKGHAGHQHVWKDEGRRPWPQGRGCCAGRDQHS